jgi:hypothetical protein
MRKGRYDFVSDLRSHHQLLFALLIAFGIVALWRGLWVMMDAVLLPENKLLSGAVSTLIGIAILGGLHVIVSEFVPVKP